MFRFLGQLLLLCVPGFVLAQSTVSGTIADSRDRQALADVRIVVEGQTFRSDEKGKFSLPIPENEAVTLQFFLDGYTSLSLPLRTKAGKDLTLDVQLVRNDYLTEEVLISATRASEKTATSYATMSASDLRRINVGQDLPVLLDQLPSTVVNSDAGAGVGYTGIRIRGSDPTRTNVTINGIPLNDPESHGVFWVNLPDLASSVNSIQVQRGVGTSTNGAAAFGASIHIETATVKPEAYAEISNSYGSFNTRKHTLLAGTGLIRERFSIDARLSQIGSDGWVDRASSDLRSYFVSGGYYGKKHLLKAVVFSGSEQTYQSWWGIPESYLDDPVLRRSNYYTYDNETDNYTQQHYQLHYSYQPSTMWTLRSSLHYTRGFGYYEQFREGEDLADYGFEPIRLISGESDTITSTDLIRRRWLDNHFYGAIASLEARPKEGLVLTFGAGWNQYIGDHFGEIIWAQYAGPTAIRDRYYENRGFKTDANAFARGTWDFSAKFSGYLDLQARTVDYRYGNFALDGPGVDNDQRLIEGEANYLFFNPKAGLTWQIAHRQQAYASFAVAHREPVRSDFIDAAEGRIPLPERLNNLEAGYRFQGTELSWSANLYFMDYENQLVLTGNINDVGGPIRENVADSYRAGIELQGAWQIADRLRISANTTFSRNKIASYTEYLVNYDDFSLVETQYERSDIAFSPNLIAAAQLSYQPLAGLELSWQSKHVGRQFLDNTGSPDRSLDAFLVNDLLVNYVLTTTWAKEIRIGMQVRNLLNEAYEPNGYTFSYLFGGETFTENYYYPQAGRHFMAQFSLSF